jgi:hypothetical protein
VRLSTVPQHYEKAKGRRNLSSLLDAQHALQVVDDHARRAALVLFKMLSGELAGHLLLGAWLGHPISGDPGLSLFFFTTYGQTALLRNVVKGLSGRKAPGSNG